MSTSGPQVGDKGTAAATADAPKLADALGSGSLPVFGTPALIALCEGAACNAVETGLGEGETTVGTRVAVEHIAATAKDKPVWAEATVTVKEGRKIEFSVDAFEGENGDREKPIGRGSHSRVIIDAARFMARLA